MADLSSVNGGFSTAPQSFVQRDRGPDLRDGRQQTSQFSAQSAPQNAAVDARNETLSSTQIVQAANAPSDSNAARRQNEQPVEQAARRENAAENRETQARNGVDGAVNALEQQLQRQAVEQSSAVARSGQTSQTSTDGAEAGARSSESEAPGSSSVQARITSVTAEDSLGLNVNVSG